LAHESEFVNRFEGCQLGTVPPFGNLFGVETFVDRQLVMQNHIAFNAGTHHNIIVMNSDDYVRMAHPILAHLDAEPIHERFQAIGI
jgi:Ala-tRNA(Pro) deacylase